MAAIVTLRERNVTTDTEFKSHFRLSRQTFRILLELLNSQLCNQEILPGRPTISPEKTLLVSVWLMATPNPFRCLSDRFGIGKGTAWRCVRKVVDALYEQVKNVIKWPTREEALKTSTYLHQKYGFPNTIGAIDGTHIKISAPQNHPETYINRKGYHSIQLQVICNEDLTFLHCYCGQIGSVHDMRVFRLSSFETLCTPQYFPEDTHLVGDAAYTIHQCIMVPFKDNGHLTEEEINFNNHLSSARMIVERSIGLLKGRFRSILDKLPMRRIDLIPKCIMACCILHNICILNSDLIDIPVVVESTPNNNEILNDSTSHDERNIGLQKRIAIMYSLRHSLQ